LLTNPNRNPKVNRNVVIQSSVAQMACRPYDHQWWANHKSNHKYKSQIICKNDL